MQQALHARLARAARWVRQRLVTPLAVALYDIERRHERLHREAASLAKVRMATCRRCPLFDDGWCARARGGCGCYMPLKTRLPNATCPQGKW